MLARPRFADGPTPYESQIIYDLETEGVHVTTLEQLAPLVAHETLSKASSLIATESEPESVEFWHNTGASIDLTAEALVRRIPEIYTIGLDPGILRLVERYLKLPAAYHGAVLRHSLVNGVGVGPRLWHRDIEDFHVLRMVIYLNDVTLGGGPFEYIPRTAGDLIVKKVDAAGGLITNSQMREILPEEQWKRITGPMGTVVLCDTARVFHHESLQTHRDRFVVMIGYSSRRPSGWDLATAHFPVERVKKELELIVPAQNRAAVFDWRKCS
jgi:hypothetical protein